MPRIGSISSGTLRPFDLFSAFLDEARDIEGADQNRIDDILSNTVQELTEFLEEHAPPYTYFGSHPGDGADFGFWPDMEAINELPTKETREDEGLDYKEVNDHGNVTVYDWMGTVILEIV